MTVTAAEPRCSWLALVCRSAAALHPASHQPRGSGPAPAWPRPRSRLQIALGNLAGPAADSCPFLPVPAALLSTCRDAVGTRQLPAQALGEGDVTERGVARPPRPHLWPGWGTGTHLLILCVDPSSKPGFPAEIPSLYDVCDSVIFCVLFQPPKPRNQSRIPSCFRCQHVSLMHWSHNQNPGPYTPPCLGFGVFLIPFLWHTHP